MTKEEFTFHLVGASFQAMKFAEEFVLNKLTTNFEYEVTLNGHTRTEQNDEFDIYPKDAGVIKPRRLTFEP